MKKVELADIIAAINEWKPPEGVTAYVIVRDIPHDDVSVRIRMAIGDYSITIELLRDIDSDVLRQLHRAAQRLIDWAAEEVVSIAGHEWN
jgi:hypothetical protein